MTLFFNDPECVSAFFNETIPEMKARTIESEFLLDVDNTVFQADVYSTSNLELNVLKQSVEKEWKDLPIYIRAILKITPEYIFIDRIKFIANEISYREKNMREPEEWKKPFLTLAEKYRDRGLKQLSEGILQKILPAYQEKHFN